jgi:outer membrane protein assembly factor BamB
MNLGTLRSLLLPGLNTRLVRWSLLGAVLAVQPRLALAEDPPRGAMPPGEVVPLGHARFMPSPAHPVGWRGDGSGTFPGATPPARFSDGTRWEMVKETDAKQPDQKRSVRHWSCEAGKSENIRWRTGLPNWSNSSPIVVGGKVFVMSEPVEYAPVLLCLDADSGTILWQRTVDHLDAIPVADQERAKRQWAGCWNLARTGACLWSQYGAVVSAARSRPADAQAQAALADWNRRAEAVRFAVAKTARNAGHWGVIPLERGFVSDELRGAMTWLRQYNCYFHPWELGITDSSLQVGAYVGYGHPTPVSDGKLVYVYTGYHAAAAYDLEGKLIWLRWLGRYDPVPGEHLAKWMDFTQSPVLVDERLLVAAKRSLTCLEAATGKTLWTRNAEEAHMRLAVGYDCLLSTGVILQVGGESHFFWYDGRVYRIRDGRPVTGRIMGNDTMYMSACSLAQGNLLVCYVGKEAVAMTFADQGGASLKPQVVWRVPLPADARNGLIVDGQVYLPGGGKGQSPGKPAQQTDLIVDLKTGTVLGGAAFGGDHLSGLLRVGDRLVSLTSIRSGQAIFRVFDNTGQYLTESYLDSAPASAERQQRIASWRGTTDGWHDGYYHGSFHASPFFHGDRIFLRSRDELICAGPQYSNRRSELP